MDPDRTELPWQGPSFLERKDPKLQRGKTQWEELVVPGGPGRFAGVVTGVFDEDDCAELIECINQKGFTPALLNIGHGRQMLDLKARDGHRAIVDSPELSGYLLEVLRPYLPETFQRGTLIDLNERCRVLCYTPGQEFPAHYDGTFRRPRPDPPRRGSLHDHGAGLSSRRAGRKWRWYHLHERLRGGGLLLSAPGGKCVNLFTELASWRFAAEERLEVHPANWGNVPNVGQWHLDMCTVSRCRRKLLRSEAEQRLDQVYSIVI